MALAKITTERLRLKSTFTHAHALVSLFVQVPGLAGAAGLLLAVCEWLQSFLQTRWEATGENLPEQQVHRGRGKQRGG